MVYCTKQQEIYQESQRSDVATCNAGWPSQTQMQTQRCGALSCENVALTTRTLLIHGVQFHPLT